RAHRRLPLAGMEHADFHVVYVDKRASQSLDGRYLSRFAPEPVQEGQLERSQDARQNCFEILDAEDGIPILVMVDVSYDFDSLNVFSHPSTTPHDTRSVSPTESRPVLAESEETSNQQGTDDCLKLLQDISQLTEPKASRAVVPIVLVPAPELEEALEHSEENLQQASTIYFSPQNTTSLPGFWLNSEQLLRYFTAGAVDVLTSPLHLDRLPSLIVHAHRAKKDLLDRHDAMPTTRTRKRSWVGFEDSRPYAFLRENMVSKLMTSICSADGFQQTVDHRNLNPEEESALIRAIGAWKFSAHDFSDDQLVHAASLMLQHVLAIPELQKWRLLSVDLETFLLASRAAYNASVRYHNFRHVVDVMQAVFYFLLQVGTLPSFPRNSSAPQGILKPSPIGNLLRPSHALALLVAAIGHDVGHPGVNNAFLTALRAPLAQLYNDKSVLESFHCAAFSQILRRYWRSIFDDVSMHSLMINSILATDMGVHFKYMADLSDLQAEVQQSPSTDEWSTERKDECRTLICGLLLKCADISNVARPFHVAAKWADILQEEFASQGDIERDLQIPTTLFGGPPELGNMNKLANSQNGFMKIFAHPLFKSVSEVITSMAFAVHEMDSNRETWRKKIEHHNSQQNEKTKKQSLGSDNKSPHRSGNSSYSSSQPELSHPEGFPASSSSIKNTLFLGSTTLQDSNETRRASAGSVHSEILGPTQHSQSQVSRRSSAGHPYAVSNAISRRSNNTSPTQLQLGSGTDPTLQRHVSGGNWENVRPQRQG
ncbi:MAG: hypothetical protein Q9214_004121, partial [Letrouitia sp. 1 TL-2023]